MNSDKKWLDFAFSLTEAALKNYGIGGKIRAGYGRMECVLSKEDKTAREIQIKRAKYREKGFLFIDGDELEVICVKIEVNKKGREKQDFIFKEDCGDTNSIHFTPKIQVSECESVKGIITAIDQNSKSYTLQKI